LSEEPKRREWPFFNLMDVYFSDQVNDPSLRLFSSTKRFDTDTFDDKNFDEELQAVLAAANLNASMSSVLSKLGLGLGMNRQSYLQRESNATPNNNANSKSNTPMEVDIMDDKHKEEEDEDTKSEVSINLSTKLLSSSLMSTPISASDKNNNKSHLTSLNASKLSDSLSMEKDHGGMIEPNNNNTLNSNRNLIGSSAGYGSVSDNSINSSRNSANSHANINEEDYEDNMVRAYERNLKNLNQKLLHEIHNLQRDGQMVDVTIAAGGKIFKAHKLVSNGLKFAFKF
jgi:hypothetical protein